MFKNAGLARLVPGLHANLAHGPSSSGYALLFTVDMPDFTGRFVQAKAWAGSMMRLSIETLRLIPTGKAIDAPYGSRPCCHYRALRIPISIPHYQRCHSGERTQQQISLILYSLRLYSIA